MAAGVVRTGQILTPNGSNAVRNITTCPEITAGGPAMTVMFVTQNLAIVPIWALGVTTWEIQAAGRMPGEDEGVNA